MIELRQLTRNSTVSTLRNIGLARLGLPRYEVFFLPTIRQISPVYSIAPDLIIPGARSRARLSASIGRGEYQQSPNEEAVDAFDVPESNEGIICAIESAHAWLTRASLPREHGRWRDTVVWSGDKDVAAIARIEEGNIDE